MRKKLKIAQLSTPFISVPPKTYGGTELVISYLTEELVRRGHQVTLFATKNSKTKAKLKYVFNELGLGKTQKLLSNIAVKLSWAHALPSLYHAVLPFEEVKKFDIIHNHFHYYGLFFSNLVDIPILTTYHGDLSTAEKSPIEKMILEKYRKKPFIAISKSQRKKTKIKLNFLATIYHGIPLERFLWSEKPENYVVWLGRLTQKKGVDAAIQVAKRAGQKLIIAGTINPADQEFFQKKIKPKIDKKSIFYIGPVNHSQKVKLLKNAKALLYPVSWEEPFGLVMIEAQACGCPVVGLKRGSVPEIVKDGETGFVVESLDQMVQVLNQINQIDRGNCRRHAEKNFSLQRMVDKYEEIYQKIL